MDILKLTIWWGQFIIIWGGLLSGQCFFYVKKKCAWNDFLAFFSLFLRKETVFHEQFSETFHPHSGIFTHTFTKMFTHTPGFSCTLSQKFSRIGGVFSRMKIFKYGLVHFAQGFFTFWSKWKRHREVFLISFQQLFLVLKITILYRQQTQKNTDGEKSVKFF